MCFSITQLAGCALFAQNPEQLRIVDNGEVTYLTFPQALEQQTKKNELETFVELGALSASIYIDEEAGTTDSLPTFCAPGDIAFQPFAWRPLELTSLNDRSQTHKSLKLDIEAFISSEEQQTALLVFRGTDFDQKEDWYANLRWLLKPFTGHDQYDEVRVLIPEVVEEIKSRYPYLNKIIATGHSLGGGLAQLSGYASATIQEVYAFDSSPVTGFYDIDSTERKTNATGLKIYRIYEHGEVLAYLRLAMKGLYPVSQNNPEIIQVRFELISNKNNIDQHSIKTLTCNLFEKTEKLASTESI